MIIEQWTIFSYQCNSPGRIGHVDTKFNHVSEIRS